MAIVALRERDEVKAHWLLGRWRDRVSLHSRSHVGLFKIFAIVQHLGTLDALQWHGLFQQSVNERSVDDVVLGRTIANGMDEGIQTACMTWDEKAKRSQRRRICAGESTS